MNGDWDCRDMSEEDVSESDLVSEDGPTVNSDSEEQETINDVVSDIQEEDIPDMGFSELDSDDEREGDICDNEETTADSGRQNQMKRVQGRQQNLGGAAESGLRQTDSIMQLWQWQQIQM